jgi:16S rRNA (cytidine1402-2'-O)-methyltransferase
MPGTLFVVATPIGNLEDVTLRALRILRDVSLIAAEDTRRTSRLLQHYSISTPTTSLHEHNERRKSASLIARILAGESLALVSDAGTPVVSDPGANLIAQAHAAGVRVEPIPGPSAAITALSASGFEGDEVLFLGFPPSRSKDRIRWFQRLSTEERILVFYEAPHRIRESLEAALQILGDRPTLVGRELTKKHEDLVVRPISRHLEGLKPPHGEFTVVVSRSEHRPAGSVDRPTDEAIGCEFGEMTNTGRLSRREILRELAAKYHIPLRELYGIVERQKNSAD